MNRIYSRQNSGSRHVSCQPPCHNSDSHLVSNPNLNKHGHVKADLGSGTFLWAEKFQKAKDIQEGQVVSENFDHSADTTENGNEQNAYLYRELRQRYPEMQPDIRD